MVYRTKAPRSLIGNDYLVPGTMEYRVWQESLKQPKGIPEMLEHFHIFEEVRTVEYRPAGWYPADEVETQKKQRTETSASHQKRRRRKRKRSICR